jgi:UDP-N-acetylmuramoyl-L-alanyl-D-glutamate--2,6-diaminopimelate ligase
MAVAADAFFGEPTKELDVVGVTGTNGKTTTAFLLHAMLEADGRQPGLVGTVEWRVGGEARRAPFTTPEAIDLQRLFREMLDSGDRSAAVEAASRAAALRRLDRVRFGVLVFTNLSQDHLDLHGTMDEYFQAKRRLFTGPQPPPAAVGVGDEWGRRLADELAGAHRAPLLTFGLEEPAEIRPEGLELTPHGSRFRAAGVDIETPLCGLFNVENVVGAVAAGILLNLDEDAIARGAAGVRGVPGRFERVDEGQPFTVLVDYAHTPDALANVLAEARDLAAGRLIVVFGCGGDRDRAKRPLMGAVVSRLADRAIVTSDNPRTEEPLAIIDEIAAGVPPEMASRVVIEPDRREAIRIALAEARPDDTVVIAGKGHEQGQLIGDRKVPFDDRAVVEEELARFSGER